MHYKYLSSQCVLFASGIVLCTRYVTHTSYKCSRMVRMGHAGDGGWNVCLDPPFQVQEPCLVLSFG